LAGVYWLCHLAEGLSSKLLLQLQRAAKSCAPMNNDGFAMLDALVAAALLATVSGALIAITSGALIQVERDLVDSEYATSLEAATMSLRTWTTVTGTVPAQLDVGRYRFEMQKVEDDTLPSPLERFHVAAEDRSGRDIVLFNVQR
jgi:hypothetical protein